MIFFEAMNIFSRKSRLASCAVSLASVSTAPKTPSSSSTSGSLEAVSAPDLCSPVVQVEVAAATTCGGAPMISLPSATSPTTSLSSTCGSPKRHSARHALLRCSTMPLAASLTRNSHKRTSSSISSGNSLMRRKRSSSTASSVSQQDPSAIAVAFPTSSLSSSNDEQGNGKEDSSLGTIGNASQRPHDDHPPRKRARRSATSIPSSSRPPLTMTSPPRPSANGTARSATLIASSTSSPSSQPHISTVSTAPASPAHTYIPPHLRYQASVYHTLVLHHEMMAQSRMAACPLVHSVAPPVDSLTSRSAARFPFVGSQVSPFPAEIVHAQDSLLITRLYFVLLLSGVPVMSLPKDRLKRARVALSATLGFEDGSEVMKPEKEAVDPFNENDMARGSVQPGPPTKDAVEETKEPEDRMDVDAKPQDPSPSPSSTSSSSSSPHPPPEDDGAIYAGPPFDSLAHMVAIMTFRHRSKPSHRSKTRPKKSTSASKPKTKLLISAPAPSLLKGSSSSSRKRSSGGAVVVVGGRGVTTAPLSGVPQVKEVGGSVDADVDVDVGDVGYVRSKLGLESVTREEWMARMAEVELGCAGLDEDEEMAEMMDIDSCLEMRESAVRSTCADVAGEARKEGAEDGLDSDSDEDREWRMLRGELLKGPEASSPSSTSTSTKATSISSSSSTSSIPILRPPSPVPSQLSYSPDLSPPSPTPKPRRHLPIRDVTNTRIRRSSASSSPKSLHHHQQQLRPSSRIPRSKIKYPGPSSVSPPTKPDRMSAMPSFRKPVPKLRHPSAVRLGGVTTARRGGGGLSVVGEGGLTK